MKPNIILCNTYNITIMTDAQDNEMINGIKGLMQGIIGLIQGIIGLMQGIIGLIQAGTKIRQI